MSSSYKDVCEEYETEFDFYKENKGDKVWWLDTVDLFGIHLFSFDKKVIFNLFTDYPHNLTSEQKVIFDKENPYWADFFKDRQDSKA
ncbi:MAG: hypothetical protein K2N38_09390 [Oscillospiraceae bacterium]|nr:hypothetical protein [Oscillospiraceae bacterium]